MWFKNIQLFRLPTFDEAALETFEATLARAALHPCAPSDPRRLGWMPPLSDGAFVHAVNRQWLIALGIEEKLLPAAVVRQMANERAQTIEASEGRRVGRKELRDLRELLAAELLPRAFACRRTTFAWIDPLHGWLVIDAGSQPKAEELVEHLLKTVDGFSVELPTPTRTPASAMTAWMAAGEAPAGFTIDQDIELRSPENALVRYTRHSLEGKEIGQHIAEGKIVTRLGMTWNDRISFILDEKLRIKRLSFLDILKEENDGLADNEAERFDLDFTLMAGELARLFDDLLAALGGEADNLSGKSATRVKERVADA